MNSNPVFETAARKARYGHKDWIVWRDRSGQDHAALCTAEAIKAAMLAMGTAGHFIRLSGSTSIGTLVRWRLANRMRRNCLRGHDGPRMSS